MNSVKRRKLEAAGYRVETVQSFLGLTDVELTFIELRLSLGRLLRSLREKHEVTQVRVAKLLGSSQSRVAKMESGDSTVSLDLLFRALLALGASPTTIARAISGTKKKAAA